VIERLERKRDESNEHVAGNFFVVQQEALKIAVTGAS